MTTEVIEAPAGLRPAVLLGQLALLIADGAADIHPQHARAIAAACSPLEGTALDKAWDAYTWAVRDERAISDGLVLWYEIEPELSCADRTAVAIGIAQERAADALAELTGRSR